MTLQHTNTTPDLQAIFTPAYDSEQRRRKLLTYYKAFSKNLLQHVLNTADLTEQQAERIVTLFFERIDSYSGPETKAAFRNGFKAWATDWISRIALLTQTAVPLLPALTRLAESTPGLGPNDYQSVAARVLNALPQYPGHVYDTDHFSEWVANWTVRETQATVALVEWVEKHRGIVFDGLWSILAGCRDLGADEFTADDLSCDVWAYVADNVHSLLEGPVPTHLRLRALAVEFARNWRSSRIDDRNSFRDIAEFETGQIKALDIEAGVPPVRKRPVTPDEPTQPEVQTPVAA